VKKISDPQYIANAICLPCKGAEDGILFPNAEGGVFDRKRKPVKHGFLHREYRQNPQIRNHKWIQSTGQDIKLHEVIIPGKIGQTKDKLAGTYIFAGYLFTHFGHFLLESLANLWFIKEHPDLPIVWLGAHNQSDLNGTARQFLALYEIENPVHILTEQTEVETLIVPEPGYRTHTHFTKKQVKALQVDKAPAATKGKKVWLSRSALKGAQVLNEPILEKFLSRQGWTIFHPEQHPIKAQIDMLKDAERIAGIDGSAFHLLMTLADYKGEVTLFLRRQMLEFDFVLIGETLGLPQKYFTPIGMVWSSQTKHWQQSCFYLHLTEVLNKLNETRSSHKPSAPRKRLANIVQALTRHFNLHTIIELWAHQDTIALATEGRRTLTASETLDFDTNSLPEKTGYLDITADQLFTTEILKSTPGLICFRHNADEQTLIRAFTGSMRVANEKTIWLIEYDEQPTALGTEENALDTEKTLKQRASANHKLLHFIDNFFPTYSIRLLKGSQVALVWLEPRDGFTSKLTKFTEFEKLGGFSQYSPISLSQAATDFKQVQEDRLADTNS